MRIIRYVLFALCTTIFTFQVSVLSGMWPQGRSQMTKFEVISYQLGAVYLSIHAAPLAALLWLTEWYRPGSAIRGFAVTMFLLEYVILGS